MTPEERRARLRQRTQESAADRGVQGLGRSIKLPLDLTKANGKEIVWFELRAGVRDLNLIDIIPFEITRPEYGQLRQFSGKPNGRIVGDWDYKLEISVHRNVGTNKEPMLCLREMMGKPCPMCDDMFEEYKKKGTPGWVDKTARALQPQWRCVYVVYDYNDDKHQGFKLWDYAYKSLEEYLMEKAENDPSGLVVFSDPFDGRIIELEGEKSDKFEKFIGVRGLRFLPRAEQYSEEDVQNNFPLDQMLIIPTIEEFTRKYLCLDSPATPESSYSEPQSQPGTRRRPTPETSQLPDNPCIANGVIGQDLYKYPECNGDCSEDIFQKCSDLNAAGQNQQPVTPESTVQTPQDASQPSQRRRGALTPAPEADVPPTVARRRR